MNMCFQDFRFLLSLSAVALLPTISGPAHCQTSSHVVISEVYGGGGNSGALYTHDFIELYNPTASDIAMDDWSVQYQSGGGSGLFTAVSKFSGVIGSHRFFLIQANPGSAGTQPLPDPDAVAAFAMAATSGKVALCSDTNSVAGPSDAGVVDFVGYGSANAFEGSGPALAPGNTTSVERKASAGSDTESMTEGGAEEHAGNGRDSDDNGDDFIRRDPGPQNGASEGEAPGGNLNVTATYPGKWNLVSLPVSAPDPSVPALFPDAMTPLYGYRNGYTAETVAVAGAGYWVRLPGPETIAFTGAAIDPDTILLDAGWNLVGSIASPLSVDDLVQLPDGHLSGTLFEYDGGYREADTIRPGHAYWARSATGGSLVLSAGAASSSVIPRAVSIGGGSTRAGVLKISDGAGASQTFRLRIEPGGGVPVVDETLPPPPPDGAFDVRIDRHPGRASGEARAVDPTVLLRIRSATPPVRFEWDLDGAREWGLECPQGGGGRTPDSAGSSAGALTLPPDPDQTVAVRIVPRSPAGSAPVITTVYPNPFNPSVQIGFSLPFAGFVAVDIYDLAGRRVATLVRGFCDEGDHSVTWDGSGPGAGPVSSGVYLAVLRAGGARPSVRKILCLK